MQVGVLEALKCPSPATNNGEDNAVFKSLLATLLKCPGRGHCSDPLLCRLGFFQSTFPANEAVPPVLSCRLQWKARRAVIETLANKAETAAEQAETLGNIEEVLDQMNKRMAVAEQVGGRVGALRVLWMKVAVLVAG